MDCKDISQRAVKRADAIGLAMTKFEWETMRMTKTKATEIYNWLNQLRASEAKIVNDLCEGLTIQEIDQELSSTSLDVVKDAFRFWTIIGGTRQPEGSDPGYTWKYKLDGFYIFLSPYEANQQYFFISSDKEKGYEAYENFPETCLPIAISIGPDIIAIDCGSESSTRGQLYNFDPSEGVLRKMSVSIDGYFQTIRKSFDLGLIKLDQNGELEIANFKKFFSNAASMNPDCDYWIS